MDANTNSNPAPQPAPPSVDMQLLLAEEPSFKAPRFGEVVKGIVLRVDKEGALVNIGMKSEGFVPAAEMRSLGLDPTQCLKINQAVYVTLMRGENQDGSVLLSLDRASGERGWMLLQEKLEAGATIDALVTSFNRGGLVANVEAVQGFIPLSQLSSRIKAQLPQTEVTPQTPAPPVVGQTIPVKVLELNRKRNRVILSERAAYQEWKDSQRERLLTELKDGATCAGTITGTAPFGAFVDLGGIDGLIHISELSWTPVSNPEEVVKVGEQVQVQVLKVDPETKKISLSLKRTQQEPWQKIFETYKVGQLVPAVITRLTNFGAFARVDGTFEGLVHISELSDHRIQHPKEVVREGDKVTLKILRIEPDRKRIGLSLKLALGQQADAEATQSLVTELAHAANPVLSVERRETAARGGSTAEIAAREK